jgi:hypothetical protein
MDESQLQDLIQTLESFVAGGPASEATLSKIAEKLGALKNKTITLVQLPKVLNK